MPVPVLCIVGKKKSGKTTLIEGLLPELISLGLSVGTLKHDAHSFEMDREGKDSWRHRRAGAATVVVSSPAQVAVIRSVDREMSLAELAEVYFSDRQLVLAEGYFRSDMPKIEVFRAEAHAQPLCHRGNAEEKRLLAMVADARTDVGVPLFSPDDSAGLAEWIARRFHGWVRSGLWSADRVGEGSCHPGGRRTARR
ncbi:molybdopterin-guanine dinucleotide biosynthesis protein B [Pseudodesulfovibrio sp. F-1]|uniref:Molybdopterin-guanine dinucleotide biosynthesis protein B n=1 Tax=Pseudodesulfovibrio alkaliphilus TaxID=2661613 RepID=A0A7K1KKF7_9BACT|nr:molybdopterin-guanine dinucleotide biosynthesis protein B [Pseudodesulfovibrio alkaliphilus]MUM76563.1 molybdopterin-guanine dinucleotide biosynthesis protein B [Pseudodesulfovibrio alkaliphilus]